MTVPPSRPAHGAQPAASLTSRTAAPTGDVEESGPDGPGAGDVPVRDVRADVHEDVREDVRQDRDREDHAVDHDGTDDGAEEDAGRLVDAATATAGMDALREAVRVLADIVEDNEAWTATVRDRTFRMAWRLGRDIGYLEGHREAERAEREYWAGYRQPWGPSHAELVRRRAESAARVPNLTAEEIREQAAASWAAVEADIARRAGGGASTRVAPGPGAGPAARPAVGTGSAAPAQARRSPRAGAVVRADADGEVDTDDDGHRGSSSPASRARSARAGERAAGSGGWGAVAC